MWTSALSTACCVTTVCVATRREATAAAARKGLSSGRTRTPAKARSRGRSSNGFSSPSSLPTPFLSSVAWRGARFRGIWGGGCESPGGVQQVECLCTFRALWRFQPEQHWPFRWVELTPQTSGEGRCPYLYVAQKTTNTCAYSVVRIASRNERASLPSRYQ